LIVEAVARYPQVLLLDVEAALCKAGKCWTRTAGGEPMYGDAVHLSSAGMGNLAPWLEAAVGRALTPGPHATGGAGAVDAAVLGSAGQGGPRG
jgi:hypothetical protein